jgi:RHS repeat-associated protein
MQRRIARFVKGSFTDGFLYDRAVRPAARLDASSAVTEQYLYASSVNSPDVILAEGATYRVISDQFGSPRLVIDATSGVVLQRMDYDAFGGVVLDTNPGFQPFGFAGGLYDLGTHLVRFGARDYDAKVGRWTVKDPIPFGGNARSVYGYAMDDPVNFFDPYGLYVCVSGASCDFTRQLDIALQCFDRCTDRDTRTTSGREPYAVLSTALTIPTCRVRRVTLDGDRIPISATTTRNPASRCAFRRIVMAKRKTIVGQGHIFISRRGRIGGRQWLQARGHAPWKIGARR